MLHSETNAEPEVEKCVHTEVRDSRGKRVIKMQIEEQPYLVAATQKRLLVTQKETRCVKEEEFMNKVYYIFS